MTITNKDINSVRIDKDTDLIPLTVGMYRFFLSGGQAGREAKDLYEHLIFTARLQESRRVRANNSYLARGLCWGVSKVKAAKAWLSSAGLIDYVRGRRGDGRLGEVYINLTMLPRYDTMAAMEPLEAVEPASADDYRDDFTPDLFGGNYDGAVEEKPATAVELHEYPAYLTDDQIAWLMSDPAMIAEDAEDDSSPETSGTVEQAESDIPSNEAETPGAAEEAEPAVTTGSEIEPLVTTGSIIHPVADHTTGAKQQMLKVKNEMLKVRKRNAPACVNFSPGPGLAAEDAATKSHIEIATAWFRRLSKETCRLVMPSSRDHLEAKTLLESQAGDLKRILRGVDWYFTNWRRLWFACTKHSRRLEESAHVRDWTFSGFCRYFNELQQLIDEDESPKVLWVDVGKKQTREQLEDLEARRAEVAENVVAVDFCAMMDAIRQRDGIVEDSRI